MKTFKIKQILKDEIMERMTKKERNLKKKIREIKKKNSFTFHDEEMSWHPILLDALSNYYLTI